MDTSFAQFWRTDRSAKSWQKMTPVWQTVAVDIVSNQRVNATKPNSKHLSPAWNCAPLNLHFVNFPNTLCCGLWLEYLFFLPQLTRTHGGAIQMRDWIFSTLSLMFHSWKKRYSEDDLNCLTETKRCVYVFVCTYEMADEEGWRGGWQLSNVISARLSQI